MQSECIIHKDQFLLCIAIAGEVKIRDLLYLGLKRPNTYRLTSLLEEEGLVRKDKFEVYKTLRLTTVGKRYLKKKYPEKVNGMFSGSLETNKIRTEPNRRERNLKLAQMKLMLYQAGVNIFYDNKPLLEKKVISNRTDGTDWADENYQFYTASELKNHFVPFQQNRNSRALGILVTQKSICIFYNTGDRIMRWCEEDEKFFRTHVSTQLNQRFFRNTKTLKTVMLVTDPELPTRILENANNRKNSNLCIDRSVQNMHAILFDKPNQTVLDLLIDKIDDAAATKNLIYHLGLSKKSEASQNIRDAYGRRVLLAFDMDLKKIDVFVKQIGVHGERSAICCMDFQKQYIEGYCKNVCDILTITEEQFRYAIT